MSDSDRRVWLLINRSHELDTMLTYLPDIERKLAARDRTAGTTLLRKLRSIAAEWTIYARYSPRAETMAAASAFLDDVKELRAWLR